MSDTRWRAGLPPRDAVAAHERHGGLWRIIDDGGHLVRPQIARLQVTTPHDGGEPEVCIQNGFSFYQSLARTRWGGRSRYVPVDADGDRASWPDEGSEPRDGGR